MCGKVFSGIVRAVTSIFSPPKAQAPIVIQQPQTPVAPTVDTEAVRQAAEDERKRRAGATGRQSTILAGGLLDTGQTAAGKALLGQ